MAEVTVSQTLAEERSGRTIREVALAVRAVVETSAVIRVRRKTGTTLHLAIFAWCGCENISAGPAESPCAK